jgi:hypothetical protein
MASTHDMLGLTPTNLIFGTQLCFPCDLKWENQDTLQPFEQLCTPLRGRTTVTVISQPTVTDSYLCNNHHGMAIQGSHQNERCDVQDSATVCNEDDASTPGLIRELTEMSSPNEDVAGEQ